MAYNAASFRPRAFNTSHVMATFTGTPGTALLTTGEMEFNEGGRSYLDAVKPHVQSSGTAPAVSVRVGYRDGLGTAPSYTSTTSPLSRTGIANFRVDARYMRIETQIVGNFEKALGVEFDAEPAGRV